MNANETFALLNRQAMDAAVRLSKVSLAGAERVIALQIDFAKGSLAQATDSARAATKAKDLQDLLALRAAAAEAAVQSMAVFSRNLYEVASDAQSEFSRLAEERVVTFQQAVDRAAKAAPAGSDVAVAAMKSSMAAATAAFDTFTKAARHATSYADAGVKAAGALKPRK